MPCQAVRKRSSATVTGLSAPSLSQSGSSQSKKHFSSAALSLYSELEATNTSAKCSDNTKKKKKSKSTPTGTQAGTKPKPLPRAGNSTGSVSRSQQKLKLLRVLSEKHQRLPTSHCTHGCPRHRSPLCKAQEPKGRAVSTDRSWVWLLRQFP